MIIMLCIPGWRFTFQVPFTQFVEQIVPDFKGVNCLNRILRPPRKCSSMCERVYCVQKSNRKPHSESSSVETNRSTPLRHDKIVSISFN